MASFVKTVLNFALSYFGLEIRKNFEKAFKANQSKTLHKLIDSANDAKSRGDFYVANILWGVAAELSYRADLRITIHFEVEVDKDSDGLGYHDLAVIVFEGRRFCIPVPLIRKDMWERHMLPIVNAVVKRQGRNRKNNNEIVDPRNNEEKRFCCLSMLDQLGVRHQDVAYVFHYLDETKIKGTMLTAGPHVLPN